MKMVDFETLGILEEIEVLVSDQLQVVSYKWLSRNYLVSSDTAKKLLQEFVDKHGSESGFEVVYTMSGWLKSDSSAYHISLVPGTKLSDAKQVFDGNCSVQVYSVQASIPKDPALLWNAEFVQAEELFKQPPDVDNCLRDNRFCGISNSFVKRSAEETSASNTAVQPKVPGVLGSTKSNSPKLQQKTVQESKPNVGMQSRNTATNIKKETNGMQVNDQTIKPPAKERVLVGPTNKKKGQADKNSIAAGASLANMWGRACATSKSKPISPPAETTKQVADPIEAQICAHEVIESGIGDEDCDNVNFKRVSSNDGTRKRRAIFYDSDEDDDTENVISLASPDPPKEQSCIDVKHSIKTLAPIVRDLNSDLKANEDKPKIQDEKTAENISKPLLMEISSDVKGENTEVPFADSIQILGPVHDVEKKDKVTIDARPELPKRRKVLKTRINDRGREVTEVVWEGEETETKKTETDMTNKTETDTTNKTDVTTAKKVENTAVTNAVNAVNRAPTTKKSPAVGSSVPSNAGSKAGNKKATAKDPKQGNIMSFFKKV